MNLGQSFLIPPPHLTAEAVTVLARFRMRIKCDGTIYLCSPTPFSCAANLVWFNSASPSAFRGRVSFYVGFFWGGGGVSSPLWPLFLSVTVCREGCTEMDSVCDNWSSFHLHPDGLATVSTEQAFIHEQLLFSPCRKLQSAKKKKQHLKVRTKTQWRIWITYGYMFGLS